MHEPPAAGLRGLHRYRAVFRVADGRLTPCAGVPTAERKTDSELNDSIRRKRAITFLIVDHRLLEPANPVVGLLPKELRDRLGKGSKDPVVGQPREYKRILRISGRSIRVLLPWIAAGITAATGFLVFLHRAG